MKKQIIELIEIFENLDKIRKYFDVYAIGYDFGSAYIQANKADFKNFDLDFLELESESNDFEFYIIKGTEINVVLGKNGGES